MDAFVQLALIEKSKRIFASDPELFLSFPLLSPLTFTPQTLAALTAPVSAADYAAAAEFARTVNFLPRDMVASLDGDRYLWDVYADVLARAEVADGGVADGKSVEANSASLLYEIAADGTRVEAPAYQAYRQYRDAWIVAREDYGAHKLTGELTSDAVASGHWHEVEEPALRAALDEAEMNWVTLGRRDAVEAALQSEREAAMNEPRSRWLEWASAFNPDVDLLTDLGGGRFAPTGFSPKAFTADTAWLHFDLSRDEMTSLVADATPALKVVLTDESGSDIEHVSFDYRSVAIVRPWFRSNVLTSRIWRSSDPELILSDGADPPSGACPAYVSAVVFIRNLKVTMRAAGYVAPVGLNFTLPAESLTRRNLYIGRSLLRRDMRPRVDGPAIKTAAERAFRRLDAQSLGMPARAAVSVEQFIMRPTARGVAPTSDDATVSAIRRSVRGARARPMLPGRSRAEPAQPAPAPAPAETAERDEISILAFICRRLPKAPDGNTELIWA